MLPPRPLREQDQREALYSEIDGPECSEFVNQLRRYVYIQRGLSSVVFVLAPAPLYTTRGDLHGDDLLFSGDGVGCVTGGVILATGWVMGSLDE